MSQSIVTIGGARLTGFVTVGGTVPGGGGGGPITHASTTGQTPDDHHAEIHTIVSHDTTATGAELTELTDGSTTTLHNHAVGAVTHASTTGQTPDDHHAEIHTIVSHDTTATGAELTELTDGSTTTLHNHAVGAVTHASTTGQTPDDHHAQDHAASHSKGGADPLTVEDLSTASTTLTHVLAPDGAGGLTMRAEAGGGTNKIACCPFGAKSDDTGKFLIANGKSSDADDSTKPKTRQPIGLAGTLTLLVYKTKEADTSTQMKIHVNGSVEATVTLASINANFGGVESISVSVAAGDFLEIEYDSAQKPGECTMYVIQETS